MIMRSRWQRSIFTASTELPLRSKRFTPSTYTITRSVLSPSTSLSKRAANSLTAKYTFAKTSRDQPATLQASQAIEQAYKLGNAVLESDNVPSEESIIKALQACEAAAKSLSEPAPAPPKAKEQESMVSSSPASALLGLTSESSTSRIERVHAVSSLAYSLVTHPTTFISPKILRIYVEIQGLLKQPESFPEIFELYAAKPIPQPGSQPARFKASNPNKATAAVDKGVADTALQAAIKAKDLDLALLVIETTYCTEAFRRSKIVREAGVPLTGAVAAPFAAYALASQLAQYQNTMDPATATKMTFAGIATYIMATSTIGIVAITTRNDQMERVTWASGLALRERWIREPERAAVDQVATAWGFKDVDRRGEEEGNEWELLKEWAGNRGMVIDKVELMEGME